MRRNVIASLALCLMVAALAGCAAHKMEVDKGSGFLRDYSQLKPGSEGEASLIYRNPNANYKQYDKILIAPVVVYLKTDADRTAISPDEMKELTDYFHQSMVNALKSGYKIVDKPGPGVLVLRTAITDVVPGSPVRTTLNSIVPIGVVASAGAKAATGEYPSVGQSEAEIEALDSQTGERIAAAVDRRAGTKAPFRGSYDDAKDAFDYWAQRIRLRLDTARGVQPPPEALRYGS